MVVIFFCHLNKTHNPHPSVLLISHIPICGAFISCISFGFDPYNPEPISSVIEDEYKYTIISCMAPRHQCSATAKWLSQTKMPNLYGNFENEIETFNSQNVLANFPQFIFYDNDLDLWSKVIKKDVYSKIRALYLYQKWRWSDQWFRRSMRNDRHTRAYAIIT